MKTKERFLGLLLSLALVLGMMPGMSLVSLAVDAAQSGENAYVKYSVGTRAFSYEGFSVQGKSGDTWLQTTYRNEGFETAMQVEGSTSPLYFTSPKFSYGGEYTQDGVTAYITARLQSNKVFIDYTVINNNSTERTVHIGSYGDVQIGNNDSAPVSSIDGGGILMTDGTNEFKLVPGSGDSFTTLWYGNYYSAKANVFVDLNPKNPLTGVDSGLAWSWTITVPANESITKTAVLTAGAADTFVIDYNANGGSGTMSSTGAEYDTTVKLEKNGFTREGYAFEGWDTDSAGMTVVYEDEAEITMPNTDTTLYAVWKDLPEIEVTASGYEGIYDGQAHGITVTVTDPEEGAEIKYGTTEGTYDLDSSPAITAVSESPLTVYYKVTAENYKDYTGSATVTIGKANITPTVTLAGWTYGGTASTPSVTGNTGNGEVTYAYKVKNADDSTYSSDVPTAVGEYTVKATVAASTSYNEGTATADFTISKANSTVSEHTAKTLTYNGEAQELVNVGSATGGTLYYAVTTENEAPDASAYTTSIPTATNAGTYYVWYSVTGNTNYNDIAPASVTVTIDKAEPTLPTGLSTTGISTTDSSTTDLSTTGLSATVGQTLADIALPEGFAWVDATKSVGNEGTNLFEAVYTPADTTNYVTKTVTLGVTVTAETTTEEETTDNDTSSAVTGEGNIPIVVIFAIFGCLALVLVGKKYYE